METSLAQEIKKIASIDLFSRDATNGKFKTGIFIGRPFHIDYDRAHILVADAWKKEANGIPQGSFLLAYYENEDDVLEALLLRVLRPSKLPTDNDVVSSMIEYYKDNLKTSGTKSQLDDFTRYDFSFSGLECSILGTFYKDKTGKLHFGADVENFYSSHNYSVIKPNPDILQYIVNHPDEAMDTPKDIRIGTVRYSSSLRFQKQEHDVTVLVRPEDFLGKRTALFGMTRTGKSNTVKKIIQATVSMNEKTKQIVGNSSGQGIEENLVSFAKGIPKYCVGQIIFDINGEYANPNLQDQGTAISELYKEQTIRFSTIKKDGFKVMKVNFYKDILQGFVLIQKNLKGDHADYVKSFLSVDLSEPDRDDKSATVRYGRKKVAYQCCLFKAGFAVPKSFEKLYFSGNKELNNQIWPHKKVDPSKGISLQDACDFFTYIYDNQKSEFFTEYKKDHGHDWIDEDLGALLTILTRKRKPGGSATDSGFLKLRTVSSLHTDVEDEYFDKEIIDCLREGKIVIVDLSQGDPSIQSLYTESLCQKIFEDSMARFIGNNANNFIQFYFEEAHNLFPKKDDKNLGDIYNRLAKEGAKLNIGLIYATQEVSSISSNILKNTQNWFIAHLNNEDETKELRKYYDFGDFSDNLIRFSAPSDKGFVRMKTYSNPFVVPVQIDRFPEPIREE